MQKIILIFGLLIFLTSCATILNEKSYDLLVTTNAPHEAKLSYHDSLYKLPTMLNVERSRNDLLVTLIRDTLKKDYIIESKLSKEFYYDNLIFLGFAPFGYLMDLTNKKRFTYGNSIFLDINQEGELIEPKFIKSYPSKKGQINFTTSLPWINTFYLQPQNETPKSNTGFLGGSTGFEYFYSDNKFVALTASGVMDFFLPVPAAVDLYGEYETMFSLYASLTNNYKVNRFSWGYGLNYSINTWNLSYEAGYDSLPPPSRDPVMKTSRSIGFTFNGYYQFGRFFYMGLIYRPTFLNIQPEVKLKYEHLISVDFMWKIKLTD